MIERPFRRRRGFTLIELMVVIGIIGILSAILLKSLTGSTDSARAAVCLANMRDLANAWHATAVADDDGDCPLAGSRETMQMTMNVKNKISKVAVESKGWVSWASMGSYRSSPTAKIAQESWLISTYDKNEDERLYALTNGAIWKAISGNASSYRCPLHVQCAKKQGVAPVWSYVMNSYFGWWKGGGERDLKSIPKMDRRLLFAELPFNVDNTDQKCSFSTGASRALDPTLQYESSAGGEEIGVNHRTKRKWYAHICFADGHTEKLEIPDGTGSAQLQKLTEWLCEATDFGFNGSSYEELK